MKKFILILFGCVLVLSIFQPPCAFPAGTEDAISLVVGQSQVLDFPGIQKVAIGDATVADVKVIQGKDQVMITGLSKGVTNMTVWKADGRKSTVSIKVMAEDPKFIEKEARQILSGLEGLKIYVSGDRVVVEGDAASEQAFAKVQSVKEMYPQVMNLVKRPRISLEEMIQIDVKLMEVSSSAKRNIGINWPSVLDAQANATFSQPVVLSHSSYGPMSGTFGLVSNFGVSLNMMLLDGTGRILSNPVLIAKNGERASFHAGGEIPYPASSQLGSQQVEWKEFGVRLSFQPEADSSGSINMKISAETSDLDYSNAIKTNNVELPSIQIRKMETVVNVRQNETLVLAELITKKDSKVVSKWPLLGQIPILGELFKSRSTKREDTNFLVFVTPTLIKAGEVGEKKVKSMLEKYEKAGKASGFRILD
jgi:pilus assembly protein CpaC